MQKERLICSSSNKMLGVPSPNSASGAKNLVFQNIIQNEKEESNEDVKTNRGGRNNMEVKAEDSIPQARPTTKLSLPIPLKNYATGQTRYDTLYASEAVDQVAE